MCVLCPSHQITLSANREKLLDKLVNWWLESSINGIDLPFSKPILMLIYYSFFFDAIKTIYGQIYSNKRANNTTQNAHELATNLLLYSIWSFLVAAITPHNKTWLIRYAIDMPQTMLFQHNNSNELDCLLSCKVIVSIAFVWKINKTICRPLTSFMFVLRTNASHCTATNAFRFYDQIKI